MYQIVSTDGSKSDPVSMNDLTAWAQAGRIHPGTIIHDMVQGTTGPAGAVPELTGHFALQAPVYAAPQQQPNAAPPPGSIYAPPQAMPSGATSRIGMTLGIVAGCFALVGLMPCLGWLNWFTLLIGGIANILCWVGVFTEGRLETARNQAVVGLVITFLAIFFGGIRLVLGAGCI